MNLTPWEFPAYANPDELESYPKASRSAGHDLDAVTRFHALQTAASVSPVF
jgi:hypothetical protein